MTRIAPLLLLVGCAHAPDTFTLAVASDTRVVALTYDGVDACVYDEGALTSCFEADSAAAAVWGWYDPDGATYTRSRWFDAVLPADEIATIDVADLAP